MKVKVKTQNNIIVGYFHQYSEKPLKKIGCNFDERTDHATAIEIEVPSIDSIHVGYSMIIDGAFVENRSAFEQAQI